MPEPLLTVAEMAKRLNCCDATVRRMIQNGTIPSVKLPGIHRLDPDKVILALSREPEGK